MGKEIKYAKTFFLTFVICLTSVFAISLYINISNELRTAHEFAKIEGNASYNKDLVYRRWAAGHGGVYVPISEQTPPNENLSHIPERDIVTQSGKRLTLVNPAYMTRQVHEICAEQYGVKGHITSLNPIRIQNTPDEWEKKALKEFEQGANEFSEIVEMDDEPYLRYMGAMIAEQSCLKCHDKQGYKVGDVRGGISVSVPMSKYYSIANKNIKLLISAYVLLYSGILIIILFGYRKLKTELLLRIETNNKLVLSETELMNNFEEMTILNNKLQIQNDQLIQLNLKNEENSRLKSRFLRNISHEFRTPMNGIIGFSELLSSESKSEAKKKNYIKLIKESCDKLLNIVNDVVEVSKIQSSYSDVYLSNFNIRGIIDEFVSSYEPRILAKNLKFNYSLDCKGCLINADKFKIVQSIRHILENAIKFTETGEISFICVISENKLEFTIKDTGIGISSEAKLRLFEPFYQDEDNKTHFTSGNGIGLSLVQSYMKMINGEIYIESEEGKGTMVKLIIPIQISQEIEEEDVAKIEILSKRILVAEDEEINYLYLSEILTRNGFVVDHAWNGIEAVEFARQTIYHLVFMDIKMPLLNGYEATMRIKEFNPEVVVIALSAYAQSHELVKYNKFAFDGYLTKPFSPEIILEILKRFVK